MDHSNTDRSSSINARRVNERESICRREGTSIAMATHTGVHRDALNPNELLLASVAGCLIRSIEKCTPAMKFALRDIQVKVEGVIQDIPPQLTGIRYQLILDTDESDRRIEDLHRQLQRHGTICNTLSLSLNIEGSVRRADPVTGYQ